MGLVAKQNSDFCFFWDTLASMSFHDFLFYPDDLLSLVVNLQVSKHIIKVRSPSDDRLVHVSLVHLELGLIKGNKR